VIIRILGEGQFVVGDELIDELNMLDDRLQQAVEAEDATGFDPALRELHDAVRRAGTPVPDRELLASDLVLPGDDTSLAEVRALLGDEGLIPG
jgi:hypothetical protein